jgi:hypothetical protein
MKNFCFLNYPNTLHSKISVTLLKGLKLCVVFLVVLVFNSCIFPTAHYKEKNMQKSKQMVSIIYICCPSCVLKSIPSASDPEAESATRGGFGRCLELGQHFPHSSAPGLSARLSLPQADE